MADQGEASGGSKEPVRFTRISSSTSPSLLRIKRDIADFNADPPPGIFMAPHENDITSLDAIAMGAANTPYEGGFFHFYLECTSEYPLKPPKALFMTTDAGRLKFNEHLYRDGSICLSTLNTFGQTWSPALSLSSLLLSIQSLLCELPKFADEERSKQFEAVIRHETMRVAVCDTVEACFAEKPPFPPALKEKIVEKFAELYTTYESEVQAKLHLSGTQMEDNWLGNKVTCQYEALLARLRDLKEKIEKKDEAAAANAEQ
nr:ubiquitin-conjugating enzyme E2 Z-like [Dermacentor andersoni]XP_050025083.1 ubiquitin-conjugating enzyme E2 Z-like [Dermacentor andersoni]